MKKLRILVVDDHPIIRKGVAAMIADRPDWELCGEACTGREAVTAAAALKPHVVVMDISMPDMNGLEATRQILRENPETEVLILSMHESEQIVEEVLHSGARGYVLKSDAATDLIAGVEALRQHKLYFASRIAEVVLQGYLLTARTADEDGMAGFRPGRLTPREQQIVQLVAEGKPNKEVAAILNISVKTVETHRARIMSKLDLHSMSDLIRYAIRNNIIAC